MLRELSRREIPAVAVNRRTADVTNVADARRALAGADVVYHAANAAYATWPRTLPPIMDGLVGALSGTSTRLVYGDNLYAYGRVTGPITESTPERASSPNELVRKRLAEQVLQAHGVIGRSSDFIGAGVTQSIFGERAIGPALAGKPA
ncbi:MAG TPA: transposase, partial [Candidatus Dormibacteraeota bacterium]|nr:transposase [Candidatus Dormibacteraeota bacterium]